MSLPEVPTDFRTLCAELAKSLDAATDHDDLAIRAGDAVARIRAVLAADGPAVQSREPASVVGEPSDAELLELMPETMRDEFSYAAKACSNATGGQVKPGIFRVCLNTAALEFARAVLARWGHHPAPPTEREAGKLVVWLRSLEDASVWFETGSPEAQRLARAADLLEQRQPDPPAAGAPGPSMEDVAPLIAWLTEQACQAADASRPTDAGMLTWAAQVIGERVDEDAPAPPAAGEVGELVALIHQISLAWEPDACLLGNMTAGQLTRAADLLEQRHPEPVPVSERLPGPEDCDAEGRCWLHLPDMGTEPLWRLTDPALRSRYHSHWLPAHALPLPSGEVQP